jgi:hypothetical protein
MNGQRRSRRSRRSPTWDFGFLHIQLQRHASSVIRALGLLYQLPQVQEL